MIRVCFLRHGEADWPDWDKPDDERPLTKSGRKGIKRVAKFLERFNFLPDAILTSPLPRAQQTAEIIAKRLDVDVRVEPALAHGFNMKRLRNLIEKVDAQCVMLVGHEPEFSRVIKELTGGDVKLAKAGVALLPVNGDCRTGKLLWLFPPPWS